MRSFHNSFRNVCFSDICEWLDCLAMSDAQRLQRIAMQHVETNRCFGVDFLPVSQKSTVVVDTPAVATEPVKAVKQSRAKTADDPGAKLAQLREEHDAQCPHCTVVKTHTQTVFGEGDPRADLMFIGEAPGQEEDRTGRPFVGRAGQKLEQMITAMGLSRDSVYIANVLKSRPPDNRTPLQGEVDACSPYLCRQIRIIQPRVLVTLGGPATKLMLHTDVGITKLRGVWAEYRDDEAGFVVPVMPTFHPAYLLRNYTPETRRLVWSDMQAVMKKLGLIDAANGA
jgi:uracil-DNA glycosylase family 4